MIYVKSREAQCDSEKGSNCHSAFLFSIEGLHHPIFTFIRVDTQLSFGPYCRIKLMLPRLPHNICVTTILFTRLHKMTKSISHMFKIGLMQFQEQSLRLGTQLMFSLKFSSEILLHLLFRVKYASHSSFSPGRKVIGCLLAATQNLYDHNLIQD